MNAIIIICLLWIVPFVIEKIAKKNTNERQSSKKDAINAHFFKSNNSTPAKEDANLTDKKLTNIDFDENNYNDERAFDEHAKMSHYYNKNKIVCTFCGNENKSNAVKCSTCGAKIE